MARIALEFGGFPLNVKLESRVRKTRTPSFKTLGPDGLPPVNKSFDSTGKKELKDSEKGKGVEVAKEQYAKLTPEQIEVIKGAGKTTVVKPRQFVPFESIDLALAITSFKVLPDEKVIGSEKSVNDLWNVLMAIEKVWVSQVTLSGAMDSLFVVYADERGLWAVTYPFVSEMFDVGEFEFREDDEARELGEMFIEQKYQEEVGEALDHVQYASEYLKRREETIQTVLAGGTVAAPELPEPASATPSLKAMLEATVKDAKKKKPAKKPAAKKKVAA
jgi:non-homologous end joining protein Ku